jgi:hypothetical protein
MAPQVGLEPTTLRLTAGCSAIELLRSVCAVRAERALRFEFTFFIIAFWCLVWKYVPGGWRSISRCWDWGDCFGLLILFLVVDWGDYVLG